jgi:hypothetical protein
MKNSKNIHRYIYAFILFFLLLVLDACTKNFEDYNTDSNGITDKQLEADFNNIGAFFPNIQNAFTANNMIPMDVGEFLNGGTFAGYFMVTLPGANNTNYDLIDGWAGYGMFDVGYNSVMSPINEIKRRGAETSAPDFWAIALILKVYGMHKVTDIYGPIPYTEFGQGGTSVAYNSQEEIYNSFFSELDIASNGLKDYISEFPGAKPFAKFDNIYGGDYTKWLKFANSLRLRLAMQLVKVNPDLAKTQAEKAVNLDNGGVFTSNEDNAFVSGASNALWVAAQIWGDIRVNAAITTYMTGYNDPRLDKYFDPSSIVPGEYVGIRTGSKIEAHADMVKFSNIASSAFETSSPTELMTAAEVYFLRAEGMLRGWNMGEGSVQQLYEDGVKTSFGQWGAGDAATYLNDGDNRPADHMDPLFSEQSITALTTLPVKWDDLATNEEKLERIIVQKWISDFPDGTLAWSTYRRTGYPKLFPVVINNSGGAIDTDIQIRRVNYPPSEYVNNPEEVAKGVTLLGGTDNGGTRLWWDIDKANF